jgi:hypothetical protein
MQPSTLLSLLHFQCLENLFLYESTAHVMMECLGVYGNQLKKLSVDSPLEDVELNQILHLCPHLEELYFEWYDDTPLLIIPNFEAMISLVSVTLKSNIR